MYNTFNLLNSRLKQVKRITAILKLLIFILIIWNISLSINITTQAKQIKQQQTLEQAHENTTARQVLQDLPPVPPLTDDLRQQIINQESI